MTLAKLGADLKNNSCIKRMANNYSQSNYMTEQVQERVEFDRKYKALKKEASKIKNKDRKSIRYEEIRVAEAEERIAMKEYNRVRRERHQGIEAQKQAEKTENVQLKKQIRAGNIEADRYERDQRSIVRAKNYVETEKRFQNRYAKRVARYKTLSSDDKKKLEAERLNRATLRHGPTKKIRKKRAERLMKRLDMKSKFQSDYEYFLDNIGKMHNEYELILDKNNDPVGLKSQKEYDKVIGNILNNTGSSHWSKFMNGVIYYTIKPETSDLIDLNEAFLEAVNRTIELTGISRW